MKVIAYGDANSLSTHVGALKNEHAVIIKVLDPPKFNHDLNRLISNSNIMLQSFESNRAITNKFGAADTFKQDNLIIGRFFQSVQNSLGEKPTKDCETPN